jgi:hypothetical protein
MDWYDKIEEPIRDIVKLLRNNGFNTRCSCGHDMYVEGDLIIDSELFRLQTLLYNYFCEKNEKPNFEIIFQIKVQEGYIVRNFFYINFKNDLIK